MASEGRAFDDTSKEQQEIIDIYAKLREAEAIRLLLTVLVLAMVLEQLQVAPSIVLATFSILFGGIVLALAISFGVGGIDAAKRMIERETVEKHPDEAKDDIEHI
jgi:hypothetical protein